MNEFLIKAISNLLSEPALNPSVQKTAKHLARVTLYGLKDIEALQPDLKDKCNILIARMKIIGMPVYLKQGFRSATQQDTFYAQGRTTPGDVITNARGLQSYHQYGLAFDLVFRDYEYNPPAGWWDVLGREGRALGLEWGGGWTDFKDLPHFQLPGLDYQVLLNYFK